jgi:hypothetical protein
VSDFTIKSREHYELMEHFERTTGRYCRLDREAKDLWPKGAVYQAGETNNMFKAFREGYAYGKAIA